MMRSYFSFLKSSTPGEEKVWTSLSLETQGSGNSRGVKTLEHTATVPTTLIYQTYFFVGSL